MGQGNRLENGRSPASQGRAGGLRPEPATQSQPKALVPNAGDYVIFRKWSMELRRAEKVTPKLVKFEGRAWPRQIPLADVIAFTPSHDAATLTQRTLNSINDQYQRRLRDAEEVHRARVRALAAERDDDIRAVVQGLASGIEAATADETRSGSAEGESPAPKGETPNPTPNPRGTHDP